MVTTPRRKKNKSRLRAMRGDVSSVPPNFNAAMEGVWLELWDSMPQSGKVGMTVRTLLRLYKERCRVERSQQQSDASPIALLPVSFGHAKDWLIKQQRKSAAAAIEAGTVNKQSRQVVIQVTLSEQPESVSELLEQPPRFASPPITRPHTSPLGQSQLPMKRETKSEERQRNSIPPTKEKVPETCHLNLQSQSNQRSYHQNWQIGRPRQQQEWLN